MQSEVYADVVFLINLAMDFFIFWIGAKLVKKKISIWRILAGALIASLLYCLIIFVPFLHKYYNFFGSVIILSLGILVAFSPKNIKELIKLIIYCHISAFAVGGLGIAIFYFTRISSFMGSMLAFTVEYYSIKILIAATAITYIFIKLSIGFLRGQLINRQTFCPVNISFNDVEVDINALLDTGNSLKDPVTGFPVIITEFLSIKNLMPDEYKIMYYKHSDFDLESLIANSSDNLFSKRLRIIPFTSLGRKNGMLLGFRPDKVEVFNEGKSFVIDNVIIAIYNSTLSNDGTYHALLSPTIFQEGI